MTRLWGEEAGRATKTDRILVLGATEAGRRRALAGADLPLDWTWPPTRLRRSSGPGRSGRSPPLPRERDPDRVAAGHAHPRGRARLVADDRHPVPRVHEHPVLARRTSL